MSPQRCSEISGDIQTYFICSKSHRFMIAKYLLLPFLTYQDRLGMSCTNHDSKYYCNDYEVHLVPLARESKSVLTCCQRHGRLIPDYDAPWCVGKYVSDQTDKSIFSASFQLKHFKTLPLMIKACNSYLASLLAFLLCTKYIFIFLLSYASSFTRCAVH